MTLKIWFICVLAGFLSVACSDGTNEGAAGSGGSGGGTGGSGGSAGSGGAPTGMGSATLKIGDETWEFDEFGCAFGYDATQTETYSFSSNSFGEHSDGSRVQMQANIEDDTGQERYEGAGVIYTVDINDIENLEDPSVAWEARGSAETIVVRIDGNRVTAEGVFDDLLTDLEIEEVPGTLEGTCGNQSIR